MKFDIQVDDSVKVATGCRVLAGAKTVNSIESECEVQSVPIISDEELAEIQFINDYMDIYKDFYQKNIHPVVI